jgi:prepilin-type processing-associated H-X9-DG protein
MSKSFRKTLVVLAFCVAVPAIAFPYFARQRDKARSFGCQNNLKQLSLAMAQYSQDYTGKLPVARIGWANAIQPYLKTQSLGCPSDTHAPSFLVNGQLGVYSLTSSGFYNGYWYNANLSGVTKTALAFPQATLLLGEGNDGTDVKDVRYSKTSLPSAWLNDYSAPCWHHSGGANYLYTDGHIKWLKPDQVTTNFGRSNCFAIK